MPFLLVYKRKNVWTVVYSVSAPGHTHPHTHATYLLCTILKWKWIRESVVFFLIYIIYYGFHRNVWSYAVPKKHTHTAMEEISSSVALYLFLSLFFLSSVPFVMAHIKWISLFVSHLTAFIRFLVGCICVSLSLSLSFFRHRTFEHYLGFTRNAPIFVAFHPPPKYRL